jgi:hypothetical protein
LATDEVSAIYFAARQLERRAKHRRILPVGGGKKFLEVQLGQRFPVTCAHLGLSRLPMEVVQVNRKLGADHVELRMVEVG